MQDKQGNPGDEVRGMDDLKALGRYGMPDTAVMRTDDGLTEAQIEADRVAEAEDDGAPAEVLDAADNIDEEEMSDSGACCHDSDEPITFTEEELAGIKADQSKVATFDEHPYNEGTTVETEVMHAAHPGITCADYQAMIDPPMVNTPDGVVVLDPASPEANMLSALLSGIGLEEPKRAEALKELREKVLSKAAQMREESQKVHASLTDIIPGSAYARQSESSLGISAYWTWTTKAGVFSVTLMPAHLGNPLGVVFEAVFGEGTPMGRSLSSKTEFRAPNIGEDLYGSLLNLITSLGGHP